MAETTSKFGSTWVSSHSARDARSLEQTHTMLSASVASMTISTRSQTRPMEWPNVARACLDELSCNIIQFEARIKLHGL